MKLKEIDYKTAENLYERGVDIWISSKTYSFNCGVNTLVRKSQNKLFSDVVTAFVKRFLLKQDSIVFYRRSTY